MKNKAFLENSPENKVNNHINLSSFNFLPSLIASFIDNLLLETIVLSATNLTTSSVIDLVTILDTSRLKSSISFFNSLDISIFNSAIMNFNDLNYLKLLNPVLINQSTKK